MVDLLWLIPGAYLLGSVSGSLVLGKLRGIDIRTMGSGNAGGTNALRSVGWLFGLAVVAVDVGKGALAAGLLPLAVPLLSADPLDPYWARVAAGLAAVAGHVWPAFFRFRGGKGAGTAVGTLAVVAPWCLLPMLVLWLLTILGTGYVGLATVLAGLSLVPAMWLAGPSPLHPALGMMAIVLAALLVFTHRGNLARLRSGTENRFDKARILRRRK